MLNSIIRPVGVVVGVAAVGWTSGWFSSLLLTSALVLIIFISRPWSSCHICSQSCKLSCRDVVIHAHQTSILVWIYRSLPWKRLSRSFGWLSELEAPSVIVAISIYVYTLLFGCDLSEAHPPSPWQYASLAAFFRRKLRPGCRPMDPNSRLVCPADGAVTFLGPYHGGSLQQVKGVHYSLPQFLGKPPSELSSHLELLQLQKTCLYQLVIYLHPGDYHRFHSPVNWTVHSRSHISGELLSVAPPVLRNIQGLFQLNERVVLEGRWRFGYFSLTAVGATNVGGININWESELDTNVDHDALEDEDDTNQSLVDNKIYTTPVELVLGQEIGHFSFGSSIVLLFEAPVGLKFRMKPLTRVKLGTCIL